MHLLEPRLGLALEPGSRAGARRAQPGLELGEGGRGECECMGHLRWADGGVTCKHVAAVEVLEAAGRLS